MQVNYVRITMLPNPTNTGRVIMLGPTSLESLEADGDFLVNKNPLAKLMDIFKVKSTDRLPYFEVVLEVTGLDSVPENSRVAAYRAVAVSLMVSNSNPTAREKGRSVPACCR